MTPNLETTGPANAGRPTSSFTPSTEHMLCSAFSRTFKTIAVFLVTAAAVWTWRLYASGDLAPTLQSSGWVLAALGMMAYTEWHILKGKTTLDSKTIQQTWVWRKRAELRDLAYVKLIRIKGLEWLIAPRLYTKTFSGKLTVFYAADSRMLTEFKRLEEQIRLQRNAM